MTFLYIVLLLICIFSLRFKRNERINDFTGIPIANVIKGICIWLVFITHISQYIKPVHPGMLGNGYSFINSFLGQMIVVPFMFYSGYGMWISSRKGNSYINSIPKRRVLTVLLNFNVAVIIYIIIDQILGFQITLKCAFLSLLAWESVGNSNWYIFSILFMYLITFISFRLYSNTIKGVITLCILVGIYSAVMFFLKPSWWYNTTFAYAFGSVYAFFKDHLDNFFASYYVPSAILTGILFIFLVPLPDKVGIVTNIRSIALSILVLLFTMKVPLKNKFLSWSGKNLFPLYIYQRIPMIVFSVATMGTSTIIQNQPNVYITICICCTILIAYLHKFIAIKL